MSEEGSRFALRDLTRADHETLDALVGEFADIHAYGRYLEGMAVFRVGVEAGLADVDYATMFGGWRPRMISRELKQDLQDLGLDGPGKVRTLEVPSDRDGLLGVLYVLEGSSLGARLLVRRAGALGLSAQHGARHLAAQTSRPQSWQAFVPLLEGLSPAGVENAARAARKTFAAAIYAFGGIEWSEHAG